MHASPFPTSTIFPQSLSALLDIIENGVEMLEQSNYPPHNLLRHGPDHFEIEIALAGFSSEDIDVTVDGRKLRVTGKVQKPDTKDTPTYLRRGIARRDFTLTWSLVEHVEVASARFEQGLLRIELNRDIPEAEKPRKIDING